MKIFKYSLTVIALCVCVLLGSCTDQLVSGGGNGDPGLPKGKTLVNFRGSAVGMTARTVDPGFKSLRSGSQYDEKTVTSVDILVFDENKKYIQHIAVPLGTPAEMENFAFHAAVDVTDKKREFDFVFNARYKDGNTEKTKVTIDDTQFAGKTEDEVMNMLHTASLDETHPVNDQMFPLVMWARKTLDKVHVQENITDLKCLYSVAKLTVDSKNPNVVIEGLALLNAQKDGNVSTTPLADTGTPPTTPNARPKSYISASQVANAEVLGTTPVLYAYERPAGTFSSHPKPSDDYVGVIIHAKIKLNDTESSKDMYYKIALRAKSSDAALYDLVRNHFYTIHLNMTKDQEVGGYASLADAANAANPANDVDFNIDADTAAPEGFPIDVSSGAFDAAINCDQITIRFFSDDNTGTGKATSPEFTLFRFYTNITNADVNSDTGDIDKQEVTDDDVRKAIAGIPQGMTITKVTHTDWPATGTPVGHIFEIKATVNSVSNPTLSGNLQFLLPLRAKFSIPFLFRCFPKISTPTFTNIEYPTSDLNKDIQGGLMSDLKLVKEAGLNDSKIGIQDERKGAVSNSIVSDLEWTPQTANQFNPNFLFLSIAVLLPVPNQFVNYYTESATTLAGKQYVGRAIYVQ